MVYQNNDYNLAFDKKTRRVAITAIFFLRTIRLLARFF